MKSIWNNSISSHACEANSQILPPKAALTSLRQSINELYFGLDEPIPHLHSLVIQGPIYSDFQMIVLFTHSLSTMRAIRPVHLTLAPSPK